MADVNAKETHSFTTVPNTVYVYNNGQDETKFDFKYDDGGTKSKELGGYANDEYTKDQIWGDTVSLKLYNYGPDILQVTTDG